MGRAATKSKSVRIVPQQKRASERVESFLDAAEEIVTEVGYEAMAMTAIAERAGSAIGALYRYFPNKAAVARAMLVRYAHEVDQHWASLSEHARDLSIEGFADRLVGLMAEFSRQHPAYLPLINAPIRFARDPAARFSLRDHFSRAFMARNSGLSYERAFLAANVVVQIMKGFIALYAATLARERDAIVAEFRQVLAAYLGRILR